MDELNMAEGQPLAESPREAKPGEAEAAAAPPPEQTSVLPPPETEKPAEGPAESPAEAPPAAVAPAEVPAEVPPAEPAPQEPVAEAPAPEPAPVAQAPAAEARKEEPPAPAKAAEPVEKPKSEKMDWYILKVQSNREESIREGLLRRVAIAGLGYYFGDVIVPTEKVTEFKGGKKKVIKRKLYPGYLVVHMEINDDTWFMVRETPGIGDFTGAAGRPSPMLPHEVSRIVAKQEEKSEKAPKLKIAFREGERVKINEGTFENFEGEVDSIDETNGRVTVMINIFGRSTPVELEYWQIEAL
jgi:transcriptional antiterminator NusG